jgi:hypothetical protein
MGIWRRRNGSRFFFSFNCRHGCRDFKKEGLRVFVHVFRGGISRVKMSLSENLVTCVARAARSVRIS